MALLEVRDVTRRFGGVTVVERFSFDLERGDALECTAIQIFTSSPRQWRGRTLSEREAGEFRKAWAASSCRECFAHDIYLTRLGTRDATILARSRAAFAQEIRTCQRLDSPRS